MTKVLFCFDVEDYVNPQGADGILYSAQILRNKGLTGCFHIVARMAQALVNWGRQDVIDELKLHEIGLHSLAHSFHPTINEYTDIADYDAALEEFLRQEKIGVNIIDRIWGKKGYVSACPPESSVSYVAHYGYNQMGCKVYAGDLITDPICGRPMHYCNLLSTKYDMCLDNYLRNTDKDQMKKDLDEITKTKETYIFYHRPSMSIVKDKWDIMNFSYKNTAEENYKLAKTYTSEEIKEFYKKFEELVELCIEHPEVEIVTPADIANHYYDAERVVTLSMIPSLRKQIGEALFPVTSPLSLTLCDIFHACRAFLMGETEYRCKESYGFMGEPFAITRPMEFQAEHFRFSAQNIPDDGFLPESVFVDGIKIGPADWLRGALAILDGESSVRIKPAPWQIGMWRISGMEDLDKNILKWGKDPSDFTTSYLLVSDPNDFTDVYLSDRAKLQSWTIRFPKDSVRMME